jgi:uncharacterized repeat protein (TIGR02543 family)
MKMRTLFVSAATLVLIVALVTMNAVAAPTAPTPDIDVDIYAGEQATGTTDWVLPGNTFTLDIWVESGGNGVQGASVHLDYDQAFLQAGTVTDGDMGFYTEHSAAGGAIDFTGAFLGPPSTADFLVGSVGFTVLAAGGQTEVTFVTEGARETLVNFGAGDPYNDIPHDAKLTVIGPQTLTVTIVPPEAVAAGANVVQNPPPDYETLDVVELTADPFDPCWSFVDWTGDLVSTANPVTITLDADKEVTATFNAPLFMLTTGVEGNGAVVANPDKPGGYNCGENVELTANPAATARFVEWIGDLTGSDNPATLSMVGGDKVVTATFVNTYTVTYPEPPLPDGGTITVEDENGDGYFDEGETITVTATPDYCREFAGWTGSLVSFGTQNPVVKVLDGDEDFSATFTTPDYDLVVNIDDVPGEVTGTVTLDPAGGTYACGTVVTLTASKVGLGVFSAWSGDLTGSENPDTLTVDSNKEVTATFIGKIVWTFPDDIVGGEIDPEPDYPVDGYDPNTVVTVTADPDDCYQFDGWTGDLAMYGTQTPVVITATEPISFSAQFSMISHATVVTGVVGQGSMALAPASGPYMCGDTITVTATAATLWAFDQWSGTVTFTDETAETTQAVIGEAAPTVTANFMQYKIYLPLIVRNG